MIDDMSIAELDSSVLEGLLEVLPKGALTKKVIKGKSYEYRQWTENGKAKSVYVKAGDLSQVKKELELRKKISDELSYRKKNRYLDGVLKPNVFVSDRLLTFVSAFTMHETEYQETIDKFLERNSERVLAVTGGQGGGKTSLLVNAISRMPPDKFKRTALIKTGLCETAESLMKMVETLRQLGCRYLFIDDADRAKDFWLSASLYIEVYRKLNMKIVFSFSQCFAADVLAEPFFKRKVDTIIMKISAEERCNRENSLTPLDLNESLHKSLETFSEIAVRMRENRFPFRLVERANNCVKQNRLQDWGSGDRALRDLLIQKLEFFKKFGLIE